MRKMKKSIDKKMKVKKMKISLDKNKKPKKKAVKIVEVVKKPVVDVKVEKKPEVDIVPMAIANEPIEQPKVFIDVPFGEKLVKAYNDAKKTRRTVVQRLESDGKVYQIEMIVNESRVKII